jgi:hypothetical protein
LSIVSGELKDHAAIHPIQEAALRSILLLSLFDYRSSLRRIAGEQTSFDEEITIG